ncbi:DUF1259 domain-containing protein [Streptomyces sp. NPDC049577]|uniref:DUF1259 domain-containing protein n=1 Tax=Streptomyces sp. NPDC049577 TaxID=3155153 RepID=UPI00342C41D8
MTEHLEDADGSARTSRRRLLKAAALAPVLAGLGAMGPAAHAISALPAAEGPPGPDGRLPAGGRLAATPVPSTEADWKPVTDALGRRGRLSKGSVYQMGFPRTDLRVVSHGITVSPGLALGSHAAFVRYDDGCTMMMGDICVVETELQQVIDTLQAHGIEQTALHKHLLRQTPEVWWTHVHGVSRDPGKLATGLREAIARTGTPAGIKPEPTEPGDMDIAAMEAALGAKAVSEGGITKWIFSRRETVIDHGRVLPKGMGATSAFIFQALGGGRAAVNGDFAMVAGEVQKVFQALRRGGIEIVELHNHGLFDEPRLFFIHFWAVGDAVQIAKALRAGVDMTNIEPTQRGGSG